MMKIVSTVLVCPKCGATYPVSTDESGRIERRGECEVCGYKGLFRIDHRKDVLIDYQKVFMQERPEKLPIGETPYSIEVEVEGDLVNTVKPGDRVILNGIVKIAPAGPNVYQPIIYAVGFERLVGDADVELSEEDINMIKEVAKSEDIVDKIINSIAPSIYGMREIKEGIALQLFGGVPKRFPDGMRVRGDINILLVGDPGTAKTQLLKYTASISPRGIYTSGKGSTAAGLTAAVIRDKSGEFYFEAGALVLADGGLAAIDEIDKMRDQDRVAMHEAMESQTVSIYKANIRLTLSARTSVLAAANPKFGVYDETKPVGENINLPPTLLSRFDLIFLVLDRPKGDGDSSMAWHVLRLHKDRGRIKSAKPPFPPEFLRKYIAYARRNVEPKLTDDAIKTLHDYYVGLRSKSAYQIANSSVRKRIPITLRQLEALIRLSEARARMRLSEYVTREDAEAAIRLFRSTYEVLYVDEEGQIDVLAITGMGASVREKMAIISNIIRDLGEVRGGAAKEEEVIDKVHELYGLDKEEIRSIIEKMVVDGTLFRPKSGFLSLA